MQTCYQFTVQTYTCPVMLNSLCTVQMQALDNLHRERSHRDMKAGNVMVSEWDNSTGLKIHLIDWANSRLHSEGEGEGQSTCLYA